MYKIRYLTALLTLLVTYTNPVNAGDSDNNSTTQNAPTQNRATAEVKVPTSGMIGEEVLEVFGKPMSTSETIGNPPITIWNFKNFSVYFEYDRVIHSVVTTPTPAAS